jgi:hypothetical protein
MADMHTEDAPQDGSIAWVTSIVVLPVFEERVFTELCIWYEWHLPTPHLNDGPTKGYRPG